MNLTKSIFLYFLISSVFAPLFPLDVPPKDIPSELKDQFTCNNSIPVLSSYRNDSYPNDQPILYKKEQIQQFIQEAQAKKVNYYGETDLFLYAALDKYPIKAKEVAILGSTIPWYESIALCYGGHPTTIEYNKIISEDPNLTTLTVNEYKYEEKQFDALLSISSFEHDGLGRYGDPINPNGDILAMENAKKMLKKDGILFLAVPVGQDCLVWNVHRIYGPVRLKLLLNGWKVLDAFGFSPENFNLPLGYVYQPVFVLQPM